MKLVVKSTHTHIDTQRQHTHTVADCHHGCPHSHSLTRFNELCESFFLLRSRQDLALSCFSHTILLLYSAQLLHARLYYYYSNSNSNNMTDALLYCFARSALLFAVVVASLSVVVVVVAQ